MESTVGCLETLALDSFFQNTPEVVFHSVLPITRSAQLLNQSTRTAQTRKGGESGADWSVSGVRLSTPDPYDLQNLKEASLSKDTSAVKFSLISLTFSRDMSQIVENAQSCSVEESFEKFLDPYHNPMRMTSDI